MRTRRGRSSPPGSGRATVITTTTTRSSPTATPSPMDSPRAPQAAITTTTTTTTAAATRRAATGGTWASCPPSRTRAGAGAAGPSARLVRWRPPTRWSLEASCLCPSSKYWTAPSRSTTGDAAEAGRSTPWRMSSSTEELIWRQVQEWRYINYLARLTLFSPAGLLPLLGPQWHLLRVQARGGRRLRGKGREHHRG